MCFSGGSCEILTQPSRRWHKFGPGLARLPLFGCASNGVHRTYYGYDTRLFRGMHYYRTFRSLFAQVLCASADVFLSICHTYRNANQKEKFQIFSCCQRLFFGAIFPRFFGNFREIDFGKVFGGDRDDEEGYGRERVPVPSAGLGAAAGVAVDGAELVAGGAVLLLLSDGGQVGDVVGGGHGDAAHPEAGEGGVVVEQGVVLGVGVDEVERRGMLRAGFFDVAEEAAEDGQLEGVEEEGQSGLGGDGVERGVGVVQLDGRECVSGGIKRPEGDVGLGDGGERGVELDAFDAEERML